MAELLLELFSEEIPARMQVAAARQLEETIVKKLSEHGLKPKSVRHYSTPRRLTLVLEGLPLEQPDVSEERKGPRVGAPEKAVQGFLRGAGIDSLDQCETRSDKKGEFYVAVIEKKGGKTADVIAALVPEVVRGFHWPKSMRWGSGSLRWVRPLHSICCVLDGEVVPFEVDHITSSNITYGHRFHAPEAIEVTNFEAYEAALTKSRVVLDREVRKNTIWTDAQKLSAAQNLEVAEDAGLLEEVTGLIELPVVLMGEFDEAFLDVPPEVLISAMRSHQKYFAVNDPKSGKLANKFVFVANLAAEDGGKAIVAGNERVLNARLADAKFFWDQDRKVKLEDRVEKLKDIVFYDKLGTVYDKVQRVRALAREIAPLVGADPDKADKAALLAKADLVSDMVYEAPELQGIMGRYYALEEGIDGEIANAIQGHYAPQGPSDDCPSAPVSVAVALADKMDTLCAFWTIEELPTGSKDPYALRRSALATIRLLLENEHKFDLSKWMQRTISRCVDQILDRHNTKVAKAAEEFKDVSAFPNEVDWIAAKSTGSAIPVNLKDESAPRSLGHRNFQPIIESTGLDLLSFFADRLKVYLRDKGARHDLIDAVFALRDENGNPPDDLVLIVARVEALGEFLDTEDGQNLLAGYKRAVNILRIEEKKDKASHAGTADETLLSEDAEKALFNAIAQADTIVRGHLEREDFTGAMAAVAQLRGPVDAFFDHVKVNDENPDVRANRLKLLSQIRTSLEGVADFSKIEG